MKSSAVIDGPVVGPEDEAKLSARQQAIADLAGVATAQARVDELTRLLQAQNVKLDPILDRIKVLKDERTQVAREANRRTHCENVLRRNLPAWVEDQQREYSKQMAQASTDREQLERRINYLSREKSNASDANDWHKFDNLILEARGQLTELHNRENAIREAQRQLHRRCMSEVWPEPTE